MMRARYLALAGAPEQVAALIEQEGLIDTLAGRMPLRLHQGGFALFANPGAELLALPGDGGFVLGRLFDRRSGERVGTLDPRSSQAALATAGQSLVSSNWGSYAAFLRTGTGHAVLRDPSGGLPVYQAERDGVQFYFSDADALLASRLLRADCDSHFALQWLAYPYLRTSRTGLAGVRELLPGARRIHNGREDRQEEAWSPWDHARAEKRIGDFQAAATALREQLLRLIPSSVADRHRILLELSGGLDSSIVATALARAGINFEAVNFVTLSADGDERRYARCVAEAVDAPLVELFEEQQPIDLGTPAPVLRPGLSPLVMPLHRAFDAHAVASGCNAFLTVTGGDNVFCYITTAAPILDAWRDRGLRKAFATATDVAALNDCTFWTAVRLAFAKARRGRRRPPWKREPAFLSEAAIPPLEMHPWLNAPRHAGPGQREHVAALLRIQHFLDPEIRPSDVESVHPLLAQPLVELCLRIPSWMWARGGRNRAVARHAMRDLLPSRIVARGTKGRLEGMCARAFARSRRDVAELLLDGRLAANGWLDRPSLESYLRAGGEPDDISYFRVMELAATELWLRSWER